MELKVYWTNFAKNELSKIFDYHRENASLSVAKNLAKGIVIELQKLRGLPEIGQKENFLEEYNLDYRYLVYKNYKIVYYFDKNRQSVEIHDIFDTRQNPIKIQLKK